MRLDDLARGRQKPEPLAVGQAAALAPGDELGPLVERARELEHQAALADAGLADEEAELGSAERGGRRRRRPRAARSSAFAADERRVELAGRAQAGAAAALGGRLASQARTGSFLPLTVSGSSSS